jgi:glyoxylase-like metal-dependent hydrolase (beta-lactamase superfamily II)/rhodanese-related sulfurtransferase
MKIEQIYTSCLSQASYFVENNGEAIVIDPIREVDQYIKKAKSYGCKIKYIFQTHFHADFVSGHVTLSKKTNAQIVYGPNANPSYECIIASDGDFFEIGNLKIEVIHTPGHTLESCSYLIYNEDNQPHAIFTGDTLFLGDVGIPDVAQRYKNTSKEELASILYDSINTKIKPLNDNLVVYPGHGAGSACGKNMMKETVDTLKNQKVKNYALNGKFNKEDFVKELTENLPEPPAYFPLNVKLNQTGYMDFDIVLENSMKKINSDEFKELIKNPQIVILDTRSSKDFIKSHIKDSIFIGLEGRFAPWVGEIFKDIKTPIILVCNEGSQKEAITRLSRIGFDNCLGFLEGGIKKWIRDGNETESLETLNSKSFIDILKLNKIDILDVRRESEFKNKHIEGALNIPLSNLKDKLHDIRQNDNLYVHCAGGYRSVIGISILRKMGYNKLINISDGFNGILNRDLNENCFNSSMEASCDNT